VTSGRDSSTGLYPDIDSEIGALEPIPMRRSPSSLGDTIMGPSMAQTSSDLSSRQRNQTEDTLPMSPLVLRRQNAIPPENVST